jgi:hypothetical protein
MSSTDLESTPDPISPQRGSSTARGIKPTLKYLGPRWILIAIALSVPVLTSACITAQTKMSGAVGLTVDSAGEPILVMAHCRGHIDNMRLYGNPETDNSSGNTPIGKWIAEPSITNPGVVMLTLNNQPSPGWVISQPIPRLTPGWLYSVLAESNERNKFEALQVDFTVADIKTLDPATVQTSGRKRSPLSSFEQDTCSR